MSKSPGVRSRGCLDQVYEDLLDKAGDGVQLRLAQILDFLRDMAKVDRYGQCRRVLLQGAQRLRLGLGPGVKVVVI